MKSKNEINRRGFLGAAAATLIGTTLGVPGLKAATPSTNVRTR